MTVGKVARVVSGNVVTIPVKITGFKIAKPTKGASGEQAHMAAFVDREATPAGTKLPRDANVVRAFGNTIRVMGLSIGVHTFHVVLVDNAQKRLGAYEQSLVVDVRGPSVIAQAPTRIKEGEPLVIHLSAQGVVIHKADGDISGTTGHYHVLIDPGGPLIPTGVFRTDLPTTIIHTVQSTVTISGLTKGQHHISVVLGDGTHRAWVPPVMDRLTVTVR